MSGALDEDAAQTLASGRDSIGAVLSTAQRELQKVFMIFVVGFLGTFYALRMWIWDWLEAVTKAGMDPDIADQTEIIVTTPFEVILLQAKIGILVGILISIPALVYLSRSELKARGRWPDLGMSRWRLAGLGLLSTVLFVGGLVYAYRLFFPIMFAFLAGQALSVGVMPTYGIVDWTEFLILLTLSFGLAAQLPLVMTGMSYAGLVQYETFRDKWKYAIMGIFVFGAFFSPPDPFTLMMWAVPLIGLYVFSLALAKIATNIRRAGEAGTPVGPGGELKRVLGGVLAGGVVVAAATFVVLDGGYVDAPSLEGAPQDPLVLASLAGIAVIGVVLIGYVLDVLRRPVHPPLNPADPSSVDISLVSADRIETLPDAVFEEMDEDEAVSYASEALDAGETEKAERIFARFDESQDEEEPEADDEPAGEEEAATGAGGPAGAVRDTATGMLHSFSDDRDEEEIGGYIHDLRFIADSLRSRIFHMFIVFAIVLAGVFTFLYQGGLGVIKDDFISRMPDAVRPEEVVVIALHPVEVLIFIVKLSTIAGVLSVVPMILYYAWPAMSELGWVAAKRQIIYKWTVGTLLALITGTALGYFVIAPGIMSYLVYDQLQAGMIISYRIESFSWLIIFTTIGIGLFMIIPFTMWMLYLAGMASYASMRARWREVTIASFAFAGMFTPASVLSMFLVGIPVLIFYWFGLIGIWVGTLGGRRGRYVEPRPG